MAGVMRTLNIVTPNRKHNQYLELNLWPRVIYISDSDALTCSQIIGEITENNLYRNVASDDNKLGNNLFKYLLYKV